ncbi:MAG TPA: response regulator transcription factor [Actinomycetota bacterium]|nr:response regulator transcription factor [Actinomycetota bacterium]
MKRPEAGISKALEAVRRGDWPEAYELFQGVDASVLNPEELEAKADSAWWTSRLDESMSVRQKAIKGFTAAGANRRAAYAEWFLAIDHMLKGDISVASGWLQRAKRHLENEALCIEQGYLALTEADEAKHGGDYERARKLAERVIDIGHACGSRDVIAMGIQTLGRVRIAEGSLAEGLQLLDEAMSSVIAGELTPLITGWIYCDVLTTCLEVADLRRAGEWTDAANAWCETLPEGTPYHGLCRVYRVEVTALRGAWDEAEAQADRATRELLAFEPQFAGEAFYELGEIRRRRGALAAAEEAYRRGHELGRDPQPGLALLRLSEGKPAAASSALRVSLSSGSGSYLQRTRLLAAQVETALALGDVTTASIATEELEAIASEWDSPVLKAISAMSRASLELAEGEVDAALASGRRAWSLWQDLKVPYEAARARLMIGKASRFAGDEERARLEIEAALASFEKLGARLDARVAGELLKRPAELPKGLSRREVEILRLVAAGRTNREIAAEMFISEHTVSRHLQNIFTKLGVSSRSAATAFAFENQLV